MCFCVFLLLLEIKLQLVDEGDEIINENFNKIILYNFIESDCNLPRQLVLDCSINNMWFPIISVDTLLMIQPYFNEKLLYSIKIVKSDESGVKSVQMINKDTNVDISDSILKSGIGQRLCSAMKTGINYSLILKLLINFNLIYCELFL